MAKLLLVDDDIELREALTEVFELEKHDIDCVETGKDALSYLSNGHYDLILLDWQLPDMDGLAVLRQYRLSGGKDRIIMLSGMRDAESRAQGRDAGADDFLTKPFTLDQLLSRVAQLLS